MKNAIVRPFFTFLIKALKVCRDLNYVVSFFALTKFVMTLDFKIPDHYYFMQGLMFLYLPGAIYTIDSWIPLDIFDAVREYVNGRSDTFDIKSDVPAILPHEIVRTPELEKAIATCNKEGLSVVQASSDLEVPNKRSSFKLFGSVLTVIVAVAVIGVELYRMA